MSTYYQLGVFLGFSVFLFNECCLTVQLCAQHTDEVEAWSQSQGQGLPKLVLSWDSQLTPEPLSPAWTRCRVGVIAAALPRGAGRSAPNKFSNPTSMGKS